MSGSTVDFVGDAMSRVVQALEAVTTLMDDTPIVVGGLAVMCRVTSPHRATVDLDLVDRLEAGRTPQLEVLRSVSGTEASEPSAVLVPTSSGMVKVDVIQVNQAEIDIPSDDPGDRLHATAHAWANDTSTSVMIRAFRSRSDPVEVEALVAEPGPLVAMKLQAVMNRTNDKEGTDLLDIVQLTLDRTSGSKVLAQLAACEPAMAADIGMHVDLWFVQRRDQTLRRIHSVGGTTVAEDDLDLVAELLLASCGRA